MIRLVLADDSGLLRESLAAVLESQGCVVVGQCDNAAVLPLLIDSLVRDGNAPDVIVTDVRMPPRMADDGLVAAAAIRAAHPGIGVLVCSQYVAPAYARAVLSISSGGAGTGYLLKDSIGHVADFIQTIRAIAAGAVVIDPRVAAAMVNSQRSGMRDLTEREREVMTLMAQGCSNNEIAARLVVSGAAVAKHVANIFVKLGLEPDQENRRVKAILTYLADSARLAPFA